MARGSLYLYNMNDVEDCVSLTFRGRWSSGLFIQFLHTAQAVNNYGRDLVEYGVVDLTPFDICKFYRETVEVYTTLRLTRFNDTRAFHMLEHNIKLLEEEINRYARRVMLPEMHPTYIVEDRPRKRVKLFE